MIYNKQKVKMGNATRYLSRLVFSSPDGDRADIGVRQCSCRRAAILRIAFCTRRRFMQLLSALCRIFICHSLPAKPLDMKSWGNEPAMLATWICHAEALPEGRRRCIVTIDE